MLKKYTFLVFAVLSSAYLIFRTASQYGSQSASSWAIFAIEVLSIVELAFIAYAQSNVKNPTRKSPTNKTSNAIAIISANQCSQETLTVSLYSLQESSEFSEVQVLTSQSQIESLQFLAAQFPKVNLVTSIENVENASCVAWVRPGDVVLGDMISQSATYLDGSTKLVIPKIAIWSNAISNANEPQNIDPVHETVSEFISQKHGEVWAGQTALIDAQFFSNKFAKDVKSTNFFSKANAGLSQSNAKSVAINIIGVEQHDENASAQVESRLGEIRIGLSSIFSSKSTNRLASARYASRPIRALRTVGLIVIAGISVLSGSLPFPNNSIAIFAIASAFFIAALLTIRVGSKHSFDQISLIRRSFSNLGTDLIGLFSRNFRIANTINTFAGPTLTIFIASSLVLRWILNFGDKTASRSTAPAFLFGMAALGVMLYGLELVGFRQRRNTLRRIVNVNAKFGRRAIEIADLSPTDCGVISKRPVELGTEETITLGIPTPTGTKEISVVAKVVNSTKVGVSYRVGFIFHEISQADRAELTRFCTLTYPQYALRGLTTIAGETPSNDISIAKQKKSLSTFTLLKNQSQRPLIRVVAILALFAVAASNLPPYTQANAATTMGDPGKIAGIVFQDFNTNGVKDTGSAGSATDVPLAGVTVKATCIQNDVTTTGTAVSNTDPDKLGEFIISNVNGDCRVEVTSGIPAGMKSSSVGADSNSLVQFLHSGTSNVMFGLQYPSDYCQNNPKVVVTCFGRGNNTVTVPNKGAVLSNTWKSTGGWTDVSKFGKVGTVYGLAYKSDTKDLFSSAYLRRKAGLGPMGIGGIYKTATGTAGNPVTNWLDLETIAQSFGETLGANPRPANQTAYDLAVNDAATEEWVGRRGIGDIDISPDNKTLYATNLNTGSIYAIDIANPTVNPKRFVITGDLATTGSRKCSRTASANDFRVFGLGVNAKGEVFVGGVCTAQSTQDHNDLFYYVFKFSADGSTQKLVSTHDLKYDRTKTKNPWQSRVAGTPMPDPFKYHTTTIRWEPWQAKQQTRFITTVTEMYPYPSISDITFDGNDLIVGMRDIYSDTVPPNGTPQPGDLNLWGSAQGDLIRLCGSISADTYTLESNRSCPDGRSASGVTPNFDMDFNGAKSFDTNHHMTNGPGGGEWFTGEDPWEFYAEGALGAVAKPSGFNEFVSTQSDPANYTFFGNTTSAWAAGTRWFQADSGDSTVSNIVYDPNQSDYTFSKAGGLGDLEALCDEAPLEIGNRVWSDDNANGIQDPNEAGIAGITVELVKTSDGSVVTTATNPTGEYKFSNIAKNEAYTVRINTLNFSGIIATTANVNNNGNDTIDSDGVINAHWVNASVAAHTAGDNDHTFDFGFKPAYAIGNLVFDDANNNGIKDPGEVGVPNVPVRLLDGSGIATGKTTTTDANGKYYFANLDPGTYIVEITPPTGYVTSTGYNGKATGPYEPAPSADTAANLKIDNDDNGSQTQTVIKSSVITVGPNSAPETEENGTDVNTPDSRNDYTVDFGVFKNSSLGDTVWNDTNSNGLQDNNEDGVVGVDVTLYTNACGTDNGGIAIATQKTIASGFYTFTGLVAGDYYMHFQLPDGKEFTQALAGDNRTTDSNANATTGCSEKVTLGIGAYDRTIDAGVKDEVVPIDLAITKSIDTSKNPTYLPGSNVEYVLTITNNGPGTALKDFTVEDKLPAELNFVSATGTDFDCPAPTGKTVTCTSGHSLPAGATNTIVVVTEIDPAVVLSGDAVVNIATVKPSSLEPFAEDVPLEDCLPDGSNKDVCNNRDPVSFPLTNGASIGDRVWVDANKNGIQDSGEVGLPDVAVSLRNSTGTVIATMNTDADGNYLFSNLAPGDYSIVFGATPGYTITTKDNSSTTDELDSDVGSNRTTSTTTLSASENDLSWDMGVYPSLAELGDKVWFDSNANGKQDANEAPARDIAVYLYGEVCGVGDPIAETTTSQSGNYLFSDLDPGIYTVMFDRPVGSSFTTPNAVAGDETTDSDADSSGCSSPVTLLPGDSNLDVDAGIVELASLGDFVWLDTDRNGIQDEQDITGIPGVHVLLLDDNGDVISGREAVTDENGFYLFDGLLPGTYSVQFDLSTLPVELQNSPANQGSDDEKDSDADQATGITGSVTLAAGEQNLTLDLGVNPIPASLGDLVFEDKNQDGIQDEGEPGIPDVVVVLFNCEADINADPVAITTTDENGLYEFVGLEPGTYEVYFETPDGMVITEPFVGTDDTIDSDVEQDGFTWCIELPPGFDDPTIDAGMYTPDPDKPPVEVGGITITRGGNLPFTGGQSSQLLAFAVSLLGAGLLLVGFFSSKKKRLRFY